MMLHTKSTLAINRRHIHKLILSSYMLFFILTVDESSLSFSGLSSLFLSLVPGTSELATLPFTVVLSSA